MEIREIYLPPESRMSIYIPLKDLESNPVGLFGCCPNLEADHLFQAKIRILELKNIYIIALTQAHKKLPHWYPRKYRTGTLYEKLYTI